MPVQYSKAFRIANIVVGCFQNITSGGVLFGWASISGSMLLATPTDGGPGLSHDYIHIMFVTASFFSFLGPLLLGAILDSYGPRVCSVISMSFICCGCVLFALSNVPNFPMFIPALSMIAFGGPGVQSAIVHLCNLFPGNKGTATAFITGSFQLSFVIFLIFDQLWHFFEYDYQMLFMGYGFVCLCNTFLSLCFWPDEPYTYEESVATNEQSGGLIRLPSRMIHIDMVSPIKKAGSNMGLRTSLHSNIDSKPSDQKPYNPIPSPSPARAQAVSYPLTHPPLKDVTLREQIVSNTFIQLTLFFVVSSFWANFIIGTIDIQLGDSTLLLSAYEQRSYGRYFTMIMTLGVFAIPLVGYMMDTKGFPASSAVTVSFGLLWSLLLLYDSRNSLLPSFMFYALFRTFLFTFLFAYLADTMGFKYFGVLAGLMFVLGGFVGLLQYPLAMWASGTCHSANSPLKRAHCSRGHWSEVNLLMACSIAALYWFSYRDWVRRRRQASSLHHSLSSRLLMSSLATNTEERRSDVLVRAVSGLEIASGVSERERLMAEVSGRKSYGPPVPAAIYI